MTGWGGGYVTDVPYTTGYYRQQAPAHLDLACLLSGVQGLSPGPDQPICYLELGCGHGFNALALAASNPAWRVTGIDFNPRHIAEARALAMESGLDNVSFLEADLAGLAEDPLASAIPAADYVSMHGVWTWVPPAVRQGIVRLLRAKLRPGGVLHLSYNALPAWQSAMGLQRVLREAGRRLAWRSDRQAEAGLAVVRALRDANAVHIGQDSYTRSMMTRVERLPVAYLAHEYMNDAWSPCFHADVAEALAEAKLDWVGSANLLENFPELMLSDQERAVYDRFEEPVMRELIKDQCLVRGLRQDVFVRGARRLDPAARDAALSDLTLALLRRPEEVDHQVEVPAGRANLDADLYRPVAEALGKAPRKVGDLFRLPEVRVQTPNPAELAGVLVGTNQAIPIAGPPAAPSPEADRFNRVMARRVFRPDSPERSVAFASTGVGAPVPAQAIDLFVYAQLRGAPTADPSRWASELAAGRDDSERLRLQAYLEEHIAQRAQIWQQFRLL